MEIFNLHKAAMRYSKLCQDSWVNQHFKIFKYMLNLIHVYVKATQWAHSAFSQVVILALANSKIEF